MAERIFEDDPLNIRKEIEQELLQLERTFGNKLELLKTIKEDQSSIEIVEERLTKALQNSSEPLDVANHALKNEEEEETRDIENSFNATVKIEPSRDSSDTACCNIEDLDEDVKLFKKTINVIINTEPSQDFVNTTNCKLEVEEQEAEDVESVDCLTNETEPVPSVRNEKIEEEVNVKILNEGLELKLLTICNEIQSDVDFTIENKDVISTIIESNVLNNSLPCNKPTELKSLTENRNKNVITSPSSSIYKKRNPKPCLTEDRDGVKMNQNDSIKKKSTSSHHDMPLGVLLNFVDSKWKSGSANSKSTTNEINKSCLKEKGNRVKAKRVSVEVFAPCKNTLVNNETSELSSNDNLNPRRRLSLRRSLRNGSTDESFSEFEVNDKIIKPKLKRAANKIKSVRKKLVSESNRDQKCGVVETGRTGRLETDPKRDKGKYVSRSKLIRTNFIANLRKGTIQSNDKKTNETMNTNINNLESSKKRSVKKTNADTPLGKDCALANALELPSDSDKSKNVECKSDSQVPDRVISKHKRNNLLESNCEPPNEIGDNKLDSKEKHKNVSSFGDKPNKRPLKVVSKQRTIDFYCNKAPSKSDDKRKEPSLTDKTSNTESISSPYKLTDRLIEQRPVKKLKSAKMVTDPKINQLEENVINPADKNCIVNQTSKGNTIPGDKNGSVNQTSKGNTIPGGRTNSQPTGDQSDSCTVQSKVTKSQPDNEIFSCEKSRCKYKIRCPVLAYLCICGAWCKSGQELSEHLSRCKKLQPHVVLSRIQASH